MIAARAAVVVTVVDTIAAATDFSEHASLTVGITSRPFFSREREATMSEASKITESARELRLRRERGPSGEVARVTGPGVGSVVTPVGRGRLLALSSGGSMFAMSPIDAPGFDMFGKAAEITWAPRMGDDERILFASIEPDDAGEDRWLVCVTTKGRFNKTPMSRFREIRQSGLAAINVERFDKLMSAMITGENDVVWCVTREGHVSLVPLAHVVPTARATSGTLVVKTRATGDVIVAAGRMLSGDPLWIVTEAGFVQRVDPRHVPRDLVGKVGVKSLHAGKENGGVVTAEQFPDTEVVHFVTSTGREISVNLYDWSKRETAAAAGAGGAVSGLRMATLEANERVVSILPVSLPPR